MKNQINQFVAQLALVDRNKVRIIILIATLSLFILGAGAPEAPGPGGLSIGIHLW